MANELKEDPLKFWRDLKGQAITEVITANGRLIPEKQFLRTLELIALKIKNPIDYNLAMTRYAIPHEFEEVLMTAKKETIGERLPCTEYQQQESTRILLGSPEEDFTDLRAYSDRVDLPLDDDYDKIGRALSTMTTSLDVKLKKYFEKHRELRVFGYIPE